MKGKQIMIRAYSGIRKFTVFPTRKSWLASLGLNVLLRILSKLVSIGFCAEVVRLALVVRGQIRILFDHQTADRIACLLCFRGIFVLGANGDGDT